MGMQCRYTEINESSPSSLSLSLPPPPLHTYGCGYLCSKCSSLTFNNKCFCIFRLQIAALHYNENADRPQALTKSGEKRYSVLYPKYKKGGYIIRKLSVDPTYCKLFNLVTLCLSMQVILMIFLKRRCWSWKEFLTQE